mgnify:CR=1 FL=1
MPGPGALIRAKSAGDRLGQDALGGIKGVATLSDVGDLQRVCAAAAADLELGHAARIGHGVLAGRIL